MTWFGHDSAGLARALALPCVVAESQLSSTMDRAHALAAEGAVAGTLVLAEEQTAGRGRSGHRWSSGPGAGIWATLIERPADAGALDVLSLRVGIRLAPVLERWSAGPVRLKWPNDLFVREGKLAGVLIEARWRDQRPDWVAIGVGVNLAPPLGESGAALVRAEPLAVLAELIPALRAAAFARGPLSAGECAAFAARDLAAGRQARSPGVGVVRGISPEGAVLIESGQGVTAWRSGSLIFSD